MVDNIRSYVLEGVSELIESGGQNPVDLALSVGLNPEALYQADLLINEVKVNDLFEEAAKVCDDRFFGLKFAQKIGLDTLGPLWLLARNGSSVGEMLSLISNNMALHTQGLGCHIVDEGDSGFSLNLEVKRLKLGVASRAPKNTSIVQVVELSLATVCLELQRSLGAGWFPSYVQFRHAQPADTSLLRKLFGENLYFNQDVTAIHITREDFKRPNYRNLTNTISPLGKKVIERELESSIGQSLSFVPRVERLIRLLINDQGASLGEVAKALNLPQRTLQYRLKQYTTSYQTLYDTVRLDLVKHYLSKSDLSVTAIAERLHFSDTAALSNFFKRRVRHSPRAYAKKVRALAE